MTHNHAPAATLACRTRKRPGSAGSRSTTWTGAQAHCQTLMPGMRKNWISPRVPSTDTRDQAPAMGARFAACAKHIGEDGDRVIPLEGDEGRRFAEPLAQGSLDSGTERAELLGQVAQERDRGAVRAK